MQIAIASGYNLHGISPINCHGLSLCLPQMYSSPPRSICSISGHLHRQGASIPRIVSSGRSYVYFAYLSSWSYSPFLRLILEFSCSRITCRLNHTHQMAFFRIRTFSKCRKRGQRFSHSTERCVSTPICRHQSRVPLTTKALEDNEWKDQTAIDANGMSKL